jgi:hypothetical protein
MTCVNMVYVEINEITNNEYMYNNNLILTSK